MSKYILTMKSEDLQDEMTIECSNGLEAMKYKRKANKMGYKVKIRRVK